MISNKLRLLKVTKLKTVIQKYDHWLEYFKSRKYTNLVNLRIYFRTILKIMFSN